MYRGRHISTGLFSKITRGNKSKDLCLIHTNFIVFMNLQFNFIYLRPKRFFTILIFLEMTRPAKRQRLVISGSSHPELGELIAKKLSTQLGKCKMTKMSNGETHVDIQVYSGFKFRDFSFFFSRRNQKILSNRNLRFF